MPWNDPDRDIDRKLTVDPDGLIVAVFDGRLVGSVMLGYGGHRGWVNYLAVAPELQGRGLGRRLMAHAEKELEGRGCPKINIQVRATNDDVIAFYEALGYTTETVVNMGKRLIADDQGDGEASVGE